MKKILTCILTTLILFTSVNALTLADPIEATTFYSLDRLLNYEKEYKTEEIESCSSSSVKSYMSYRMITDPTSPQYNYIREYMAVDENTGLLYDSEGFIGVALGSYYGEIGDRYYFTLSSGIVLPIVKIEQKADKHTTGQCYQSQDKSVIEFVVDVDKAGEYFGRWGDKNYIMSGNWNYSSYFKGEITKAEKVLNEKIEVSEPEIIEGNVSDAKQGMLEFEEEVEEEVKTNETETKTEETNSIVNNETKNEIANTEEKSMARVDDDAMISVSENDEIAIKYNELKDKDLSTYTEESVNVFKEALAVVKVIVDQKCGGMNQISTALDNLNKANENLKEKERVETPKSSLENGTYYKESVINFTNEEGSNLIVEIFLNGQRVEKGDIKEYTLTSEKGNSNLYHIKAYATKEGELDSEVLDLEITIAIPNKEELDSLIKTSEEKYTSTELAKYTDSTVKVYNEKLASAKTILAKEEVSQKEIDTALSQLKTAINGLKVPTETKTEAKSETTSTTKTYDPKDTNKDGVVSCEEENGKGWIWSENSKKCIYKVVNTATKKNS